MLCLPLRSGQIEAVGVHYLGPCPHEITQKLVLRVGAAINLCHGAQLRV